jgi:amidase
VEGVNALAGRSAAALRDLVATRQVSARDVLAACVERLHTFNPRINAVVTLNPRAEEEAAAVDARLARGSEPGLLCGLPVGIKDVTPVASLRTTYGSPIYADHVATEDALVVQRLRQADAVILGKTNCPEFAAGGNTFNDVFGRTRNPWDLRRSAGGSTGGGAAALVSGMIALAEGTDLGGSLRIPASFCGVVGLRPSVGLVPTHPTDWMWDTLQVTGPMARTAEDVALMLQAVSGPSDLSPLAQPMAERDFVAAVRDDIRDGRVAYCRDPAGIGIDADVERVSREAAFSLTERGLTVEEIDIDLTPARDAFLSLRGLWFVTQMFPRLDQESRFGVNVGNNVRAGLKVTTHDLARAEQQRARVWHLARALFTRFDLIVTPCMAVPPFPVEQNFPDTIAGKTMENYVDWIAPTFVWSLTGLPVASVPAGIDREGLPVGLQIIGPPRGEEAVLRLAHAIERLRPLVWHPPAEQD